MLRSFKNLELLRYYVSNSMEKNFHDFLEKDEQDSLQLASSVFSTTFSLVATFVSTKVMDEISIKKNIILIIFIFVIGFSLSYNLYIFIFKIIRKIKFSFKKYITPNDYYTIKQLIDDFDNIACDNVLIAKEFICHYYREEKKKDIKSAAFAYYEALYYLKTSGERVKKVLCDEVNCINNQKEVTLLNLYRVVNVYSMMKDVYAFIAKEKDNIVIENDLKKELSYQIEHVKEILDEINTQIEKKRQLI